MASCRPVDCSRPFLPEDQTQLYYTPGYALLDLEQRIRYNQLFGLRVNEYIMMLEREFVEPVLWALRRRARRFGSASLVRELEVMREEEAAHYDAFAALNRRCEPELYAANDYWFMQLKPYERAMIAAMNSGVCFLPFALWIIVAMEESSIGLAAAMRRAGDTALGTLDPHFVEVHREHAKDEARHIHVDVHLVQACLHSYPGSVASGQCSNLHGLHARHDLAEGKRDRSAGRAPIDSRVPDAREARNGTHRRFDRAEGQRRLSTQPLQPQAPTRLRVRSLRSRAGLLQLGRGPPRL